MLRARYLVVALALGVLLVVAGAIGFVAGQNTAATDETGTGSAVSGDDTDSMMNGGDVMSSQMMGSFDEEGKPFDLQFIDQMIPHHEGALMSSEHMISNSDRPELRQLYENIQKSQSEQIDQMQEWRKEWYPDAQQLPAMMGDGQAGSMMGGNVLDIMFLKMMIPHHQMAVDMSEEALSKAEHPELRNLAQEIRDEQFSEIELMQEYLQT